MLPIFTARHRSKPPVHWSLMSKADPRCCVKAAVDAPRVPTPGAPDGEGCSRRLLIGLRWHIPINPVIISSGLVFSIWCLGRRESEIRINLDPQIHCSVTIFHIEFFFMEAHTKTLQAPCPTQHWPPAHAHNTYPMSLVPEALGSARPLETPLRQSQKMENDCLFLWEL